MTTVPLTHKESIWLACKLKTCCYQRLVTVTGRDVWRIARALNLDPWSFLIYFEAPAGPQTFILGHDQVHHRLALADRFGRQRMRAKPCIFLMRTRGGHRRCGLGDLRPLSCRTFPVQLADGEVCVPQATPCSCRQWTRSEMFVEQERPLVYELEDAREEFADVLARWNEHVLSTPADSSFSLADFCSALMNMYDEVLANPEPAET